MELLYTYNVEKYIEHQSYIRVTVSYMTEQHIALNLFTGDRDSMYRMSVRLTDKSNVE